MARKRDLDKLVDELIQSRLEANLLNKVADARKLLARERKRASRANEKVRESEKLLFLPPSEEDAEGVMDAEVVQDEGGPHVEAEMQGPFVGEAQ